MANQVISNTLSGPDRLAEYKWAQEPSKDPFTATIPARNFLRAMFIRFVKSFLSLAYGFGLMWGLKMYAFTRLLIQA
jgi:hypothetical protein